MGIKRAAIRASVRDILRDEFVEGKDLEWQTDELNRLIRIKLDQIEDKMPQEAKVLAYDALSTVATELSASATTLVVASDDAFSTSYPFYITIDTEALKVTALLSGDNYTVTRAQLGTTAAIHIVGKDVGLSILTSSESKEIDLTNISDFIRVRNNRPVEYRTGRNPKQFRNATVFADTLTMDINILPSANETVHLYCFKRHTLTDKTSTLRPEHEAVLILGVCADAARNKGREQINGLNLGGVNVGPRMIEVGERWKKDYEQALKRHTVVDNWEALPKD